MEPKDYTVIDLEMTGLSAKSDKVIEIGAVHFRDGKIAETYATLVNPHIPIPARVTELTGITDDMVQQGGIKEDDALAGLIDFIGDDVIVGHNVGFDYSFLKQWAVNKKRPLAMTACDTLKIARQVLPGLESKTLENLCVYYQIKREQAHRALDDSIETGILFEKLKEEIEQRISEKKMTEDTARSILAPKALQYKAKRQTPATQHQIRQLKEFRQLHQITEPVAWEVLTRNEASRIMDRYYSQFGRS